jgi:hypothetical protein
MRRIACEADDSGTGEEIVAIYNKGLGQGKLPDAGLDEPYEPGSVAKLGYVSCTIQICHSFDQILPISILSCARIAGS